MDSQEIFDKVYLGLKSQNFQQSSVGDVCQYRGPNGLKCAVGHLMTDEEYDPAWDKQGGVSVHNLGKFTEDNIKHVRLLEALQDIHDWHPDNMKEKLEEYAEIHKFTVPE